MPENACPVTGEVCRHDWCDTASSCHEYFSYPKLHREEINEAVDTPTFDLIAMQAIEGLQV